MARLHWIHIFTVEAAAGSRSPKSTAHAGFLQTRLHTKKSVLFPSYFIQYLWIISLDILDYYSKAMAENREDIEMTNSDNNPGISDQEAEVSAAGWLMTHFFILAGIFPIVFLPFVKDIVQHFSLIHISCHEETVAIISFGYLLDLSIILDNVG